MENEKLSNAYVQKYDPVSDSFIVVESKNQTEETKSKKFEPFSFFKRNKTKAMESDTVQPQPVAPQPMPQPNPSNPYPGTPNRGEQPSSPFPPSSPNPQTRPPMQNPNNPILIARNIYNKMRVLHSLYQTMASTYPSKAELFNELASEISILQATMLSIYQTLSGNNFIPQQRESFPILTRNYCEDVLILQKYLQEIIDLTILLQRSVNVQNIDRQLAIINATLLSQKSKLETEQSTYCIAQLALKQNIQEENE